MTTLLKPITYITYNVRRVNAEIQKRNIQNKEKITIEKNIKPSRKKTSWEKRGNVPRNKGDNR